MSVSKFQLWICFKNGLQKKSGFILWSSLSSMYLHFYSIFSLLSFWLINSQFVVDMYVYICYKSLIICSLDLLSKLLLNKPNYHLVCGIFLENLIPFSWSLADHSLTNQFLSQVFMLKVIEPVSTLVVCRTVKTQFYGEEAICCLTGTVP